MITISDDAQAYMAKLLAKEREKNKAVEIRIEAVDLDTPFAECGIRFFVPGPEHTDDLLLGFQGFQLYVDSKSVPYLEGTIVNLEKNGLTQDLVMETPNLNPLNYLGDDAPLFDRIVYVIESEINPELANHGGMVRLVDISDAGEVTLQFGGGCQGCGMVDVTLKQGIEKKLMERFPEISVVHDSTDHEGGENPYY